MVANEPAYESAGNWIVPPQLQQSLSETAEAVRKELAPPRPALRLICRYETLPVGVISRLIAKMHDLSPRQL